MNNVPARLSLKVVPGASRNEIAGWLGERLKVRVKAPAESGKANNAVRILLASVLGVPKSSVVIVVGSTSPMKILEIQSLSEKEIRSKLGACTQCPDQGSAREDVGILAQHPPRHCLP